MAPSRAEKLLSSDNYDNDATLVEDGPHDNPDPESEDESDHLPEAKDTDHEILREQAEQEKLLTKPERFEAVRQAFKGRQGRSHGKRQRNGEPSKSERRRQRGRSSEGDTVFEMEGGYKDTPSRSSSESLDQDAAKIAKKEQSSKGIVWGRLALIHLAIVLLFIALAFGAYKASKHTRPKDFPIIATLSNGTHLFAPTTLLISLDGFRADFLDRNITPALDAFIKSGVSPKFMLPSFPSVTFPNHFTLVTGLYPESHGVVGNQFWDPELQDEFFYTNPASSMQPKWWTAEPLWVTAEHQGVRTAVHMWPGSEAHIPDIEPTFLDKFNASEDLTKKVDRVLGWLDLSGDGDSSDSPDKRPQLIALYVPDVDADGHLYGPNSTEIMGTIADVDSMLTMIFEGLLSRNLTEIINLIIVSDHGMATTSTNRLIQLDDLIDLSLVDHIDGWPLRGLRLKNPDRDVPVLYEQLLQESEKSGNFEVYTLDTMPERYHFTNNHRIAPLWIMPKTGWAVVERKNYDVAEAQTIGRIYRPMGLHGYDHEDPLMRAVFVARGPAFPHEPNSRVAVFQNIEVYNIVCDSLGIKPHPNNGTLRLPLKTEGLHGDVVASLAETSAASEPQPQSEGTAVPTTANNEDSQSADDELPPAEENLNQPVSNWWSVVHDQLEKAKEWAKHLFDSIKGNKAPQETDNEEGE